MANFLDVPTDAALEAYLGDHDVIGQLRQALTQICVERPADPTQFLAEYFAAQSGAAEAGGAADGDGDLSGSSSAGPRRVARRKARVSSSEGGEGASGGTGESGGEVDEDDDRRRRGRRKGRKRRGGMSGPTTSTMVDDLVSRTVIPKDDETRARLDAILAHSVMFAHLDDMDRQDVYDAMFDVEFEAGEVIINQGDDGDNFYVIDSGVCDIYVQKGEDPPELVVTFHAGDTFGELALMYDQPRAATVTAQTACKCWAIDRFTYSRTVMGAQMRKRRTYEQFLGQVEMLKNMSKYEMFTLADAILPVNFDDGDVIISEGDTGDAFYMVLDGQVRCTKGADNHEVAVLGPSTYFGEIALLTDRPRAATVTADGPVKCVYLTRDRFTRVLGPAEAILRRNLEQYNAFVAGTI